MSELTRGLPGDRLGLFLSLNIDGSPSVDEANVTLLDD